MIESNIILFILMVLCTFVFEHKVLPQLAIVTMAIYEIYISVVGVTVTQSSVIPIFMFVINLLYASYMIITEDDEGIKGKIN